VLRVLTCPGVAGSVISVAVGVVIMPFHVISGVLIVVHSGIVIIE